MCRVNLAPTAVLLFHVAALSVLCRPLMSGSSCSGSLCEGASGSLTECSFSARAGKLVSRCQQGG